MAASFDENKLTDIISGVQRLDFFVAVAKLFEDFCCVAANRTGDFMRNCSGIDRAEVGRAGGKDCLGSVTVFIMIGIIVGDNLRIVGRILKVCKQLMRQIVRV